MKTKAKVQLTSSGLGVLWNFCIWLPERLLIYDFFKDTTNDTKAKNIIVSVITEFQNIQDKIKNIFINENAVIISAFSKQDILKEAPPLYKDIFHIMFLRQMMKLTFGFDAVYTAISYKKEVQNLFKLHFDVAYKYYTITTDYLLRKGVLAKPPFVTAIYIFCYIFPCIAFIGFQMHLYDFF